MGNKYTIAIPDSILHRRGARKIDDIPGEVVELLHKGYLQTANLTEWLAVDHTALLRNVLEELDLRRDSASMIQRLQDRNEKKIMKIIPAIAREWLTLLEGKPEEERTRINETLAAHLSDSVRCWAAYMIGLDENLSLDKKLARIRPFAADLHFGVREIAWMSVRDAISNDLAKAIDIFSSAWVRDDDANVRRFAIESTRPQGVWAKHIAELKTNPAIALPLLEAVKSDPAKYVQDSVSNWLNDASKTNSEWVVQVCETWLEASNTKETKRIVSRAQRSLAK